MRLLSNQKHGKYGARGVASLLTAFAIILNLLAPLTHSVAMTTAGSELVEICTSGGIDYVRVDHFEADQKLADEECPICGECPVCWMANPVKILAVNQETYRFGRLVSHAHYSSHRTDTARPQNWSWPESRAPPQLKPI